MANFAEIIDGVVVRVLGCKETETAEGLSTAFGGVWIQTSYNTREGKHSTGGTPFRKNYAGVGYTYDALRDAFIPPKPFPSWGLNEATCQWEPPVPYPGGMVRWDETALDWV